MTIEISYTLSEAEYRSMYIKMIGRQPGLFAIRVIALIVSLGFTIAAFLTDGYPLLIVFSFACWIALISTLTASRRFARAAAQDGVTELGEMTWAFNHTGLVNKLIDGTSATRSWQQITGVRSDAIHLDFAFSDGRHVLIPKRALTMDQHHSLSQLITKHTSFAYNC